VLAQINKERRGQLGEEPLDSDVMDYVSTQNAALDYLIGRLGVPVGRLTIILGQEGAGKTTVGHHILAETQRRGGTAVLIDAERRYTRDRGARIGIDHSRLIVFPGDTVEQSFGAIDDTIVAVRKADSTRLLTILYDSLAGGGTNASMEGKHMPAEHARLWSGWLREHHGHLARHNVCFVVVNQYRQKIDMGGGPGFVGVDTKTYLAEGPLKYWASLRLDLRLAGKHGPDKARPTGIIVEAEVKKSTISPRQHWKMQFVIDKMNGVDRPLATLEVAKHLGLVKQSQGWLSINGRDSSFHPGNWGKVAEEHPEILEKVAAAPLDWTT
jgi:recombination protein RecA